MPQLAQVSKSVSEKEPIVGLHYKYLDCSSTGLLKFSETKDSLVVAETDKSSKYFQVQKKPVVYLVAYPSIVVDNIFFSSNK